MIIIRSEPKNRQIDICDDCLPKAKKEFPLAFAQIDATNED